MEFRKAEKGREITELLSLAITEFSILKGISAPKMAKVMLKTVADGYGHLITEGRPSHAILHGLLYPDVLTGKKWGWILFLFVDEEHRDKGVAKRLIQGFIDWSTEKGCSNVRIDALLNDNFKKMHNLFCNLNFKPKEVHYYREVK